MLAKLVHELPKGDYLYEPKWDGFRCIVFRDGDSLELLSRNERPLQRYFPELPPALRSELPRRCVVDGEIVIATDHGLDFDALLLRIHPATSRVEKLAQDSPAAFVAFDLIALDNQNLCDEPMSARRLMLEEALADAKPPVYLTPATTDVDVARDWFERFEGAGLDGVIAKPNALTYHPGERAMIKVKHERTAECVVGGFRRHVSGSGVGSLLLGLYDARGRLHHVGVATGFTAADRLALERELAPLTKDARRGHPWAGWRDPDAHEEQRLPGGQSRWTGNRDLSWEAVRPELVAEVAYDHLQGTRFRHATRFVRWRPDRVARSCTYDQLDEVPPRELREVFGAGIARRPARVRPRAARARGARSAVARGAS
jgi:ATP-dependent DNA ligase